MHAALLRLKEWINPRLDGRVSTKCMRRKQKREETRIWARVNQLEATDAEQEDELNSKKDA